MHSQPATELEYAAIVLLLIPSEMTLENWLTCYCRGMGPALRHDGVDPETFKERVIAAVGNQPVPLQPDDLVKTLNNLTALKAQSLH